MSYATDLAKELNKRNNGKYIGNISGTILSVNPLRIGILNNQVILDSCSITKTFKTLLDSNLALAGDTVLLVTDAEGQTFFIVDKVVT